MNKFVALLRGINVGGNCKVEMKKLKATMEDLGFKNVITYINSGNVIFESTETSETKLVGIIEDKLEKVFKFKIPTVVRSKKNLLNLSKKLPKDWQNDGVQKTDILFLWDKYDDKKSIKLLKINPAVDNLLYIKGAIVWNIKRGGYNKTGMRKFIGTELYKNMTARNINTVRKLAEMIK